MAWTLIGRLVFASGNKIGDDLGVFDPGEPLVEPEVFVSESFVVDSKTLKNGGVEVVHVDGVFHDVVGEVVGFAVFETGLDPSACHPHGEAASVMIASVVVLGQFPLRINGATEFASADHDGVLEQPALLEVTNEGGSRLVDILALLADFGR